MKTNRLAKATLFIAVVLLGSCVLHDGDFEYESSIRFYNSSGFPLEQMRLSTLIDGGRKANQDFGTIGVSMYSDEKSVPTGVYEKWGGTTLDRYHLTYRANVSFIRDGQVYDFEILNLKQRVSDSPVGSSFKDGKSYTIHVQETSAFIEGISVEY